MRDRAAPLGIWGLLALLVLAGGPTGGCARGRPAQSAPAVKQEPEPPPPPPPAPAPGEREMEAAEEALEKGEVSRAADLLEFVIALGRSAPARPDALYTLALLKARPANGERDVAGARRLLREVLAESPSEIRATEARFVLALLDLEQEHREAIAELQDRVAVSEAEADRIRLTLAQREEELRRIKEILLGETGGL